MIGSVDFPAGATRLVSVLGAPAENGVMGRLHVPERATVDRMAAVPAGSAEATTRPVSGHGWSSRTPTSTFGTLSR